MKLIDKDEYYSKFDGSEKLSPEDKAKRYQSALAAALDIRKFEIEMYWKRATYFWTFIGVIFAGYFVLLQQKYIDKLNLLILICLGFIFSFCWYLVNKGSKFWQDNWERQVDMLEDEVHGPLYKTIILNEIGLINPNKAYPFSVSKLNQYLSLFVAFIWFLLGIKTLVEYKRMPELAEWMPDFAYFFIGITIIGSLVIFLMCRAGFMKDYSRIKEKSREIVLRDLPVD